MTAFVVDLFIHKKISDNALGWRKNYLPSNTIKKQVKMKNALQL